MRRQHYTQQAVLLGQRCLDLPIHVLALIGQRSYQYDGAGRSHQVVVSDSLHDVIDVIAVNLPFERVVEHRFKLVVEEPGKFVVEAWSPPWW